VGRSATEFPLPVSANRLRVCLYFRLLPSGLEDSESQMFEVFSDGVSYPC